MNAGKYVAFEAEGLASRTNTRDFATDMWVFQLGGHMRLHPNVSGPVQPYLMLGYGAIASVVDDKGVEEDDQDGVGRAGLGLRIRLTDRLGLRLEGRVQSSMAFASDWLALGDETGYSGPDFLGLASVFVNLGATRPKLWVEDKVVIKDPEIPDDDRDGLHNRADRCPKDARRSRPLRGRGRLPRGDNDGDGLADAQDRCPVRAETKNGIDDQDGCPEIDEDGDKIVGSMDQCPKEVEAYNGFKDTDGCPDALPEEVRRFTGVIQGINFRNRSAVLIRNSFPLLDRAVEVLKQYPELKIEISGHTDGRGKADFNRELSQKRAETVREYLPGKGIEAEPDRGRRLRHGSADRQQPERVGAFEEPPHRVPHPDRRRRRPGDARYARDPGHAGCGADAEVVAADAIRSRNSVRHLTAVLLGLLPGLLSHAPAEAGSLPPEAIRSVVRLFGNQHCATGFLLDNGDLVTNAHVVHDVCGTLPCAGVRLHIATTVGQEITEEITPTRFAPRFISDAVDLAIVALEGGPERKGYFKLGGPPSEGQHVTIAGFPGCGPLTVAEGNIQEIDAIGFLSSAEVRSGNSGSPVLDDQMQIVGVSRRYASEVTGRFRNMTGSNPVGDSKAARADLLPRIAPGGASSARALLETALRYQEEAFALPGPARTPRLAMLDEFVDFLREDRRSSATRRSRRRRC